MDWSHIIVLALIQGLTEFLPISSSAHLILPAQVLGWPDQGLAFDVGVHFGTLLAVLVYFMAQLTRMASAVVRFPLQRQYTEDFDLVLKLAVATLPVLICGFLGKDLVETHLRTIPVIAGTTLVFGLLLWFADRNPQQGEHISWGSALIIGMMQVLALIPGTSRSGITITAALMVGLSRTRAAQFSFLLAIPTISGAQLLLTLDLLNSADEQRWIDLFSGAAIAGIAAYLCIHYFIALVERTGMLPYVIYRMVLGVALLGFYFL